MRNAADADKGFKGSPVVGYIRSAKLGDPRLDEWEAGLRRYAAEHGYNLMAVVRDEGVSVVAVWKPGLEQVLKGMEDHRFAGIIVPGSRMLGRTPAAVQRVRERIERSAAWLEIIGLDD